jgi:hypothetical protein
MTDPDAPSPSDPTMREYLHWYELLQHATYLCHDLAACVAKE